MTKIATLGQIVAEAVRDSLRAGTLGLGERLIELALAQRYHVSQAAVRDALRLLEREGWVVYTARHGVRVRDFTPDAAHEVFALMAEIESLALLWAVREQPRAHLLASLHAPIEAARRAQDHSAWPQRRAGLLGFHAALAQLSGRPQTPLLLSVLHNQVDLLMTAFDLNGSPEAHREAQLTGYEHVYGVLRYGGVDEAQAALRARIQEDGTPIIRWLAGR